jgi:hypothetical protein
MSAAHTPGPWEVIAHTAESPEKITPGCDWTIRGANGVAICMEGERNENAAADARLIQAAPELLLELKEAHEVLGNICGDYELLDRLGALIAKVEGEAYEPLS